MKSKNGFTLIEVLIVVVIIGILASLVIPRFLGQTEKGRMAEAIGFLSAIRRGELVYFNENSAYLPITITTPPTAASTAAENAAWQQLGMTNPNDPANFPNNFFTYTVVVAGPPPTFAASATRNGVGLPGGDPNDGTQAGGAQLSLNDNGTWGGTGSYAPGAPLAP